MRERHEPRLCKTCQAPMARQAATCWRCGAVWASPEAALPDDGQSLRDRTAHVLVTRADRRAARVRRDRHAPV